MGKENKKVTINDVEGKACELEILEEFTYKDKNYVMLYEEDECTCGDNCECGEDSCNESIYIYEVNNVEGKDNYSEITDEKLMSELIDEAEKLLYKEDK